MANYEQQSDGFTYDVFLSFRGEDTRETIVGYVLDAFEKRGINVFYDDKKLELGEDISPALYKAIEESNISVIVFSKNYASSRWCLDELAKIMECTKRNNKQIAFPIFYHVDPSDVRHQRNSYGEAMAAQQKRFGKYSEKIKAWKAALSQVADLKGHHIDTGFEINHVKEIVEKVHAKIPPKSLFVGENPIGVDQHIEEIKSLLQLKPNKDSVCILGIYGLGGIGKTSLAKALYNKIAPQFEAACFLANVREKSKQINGLENLQLTLLSEMHENSDSRLGSTTRGIKEIKLKLRKKKVLLVLDDVNEMKQLDNLAGGSDWFGPGSRIIITARDKGLLIATHQIEVKTYEMVELNDRYSLELFCRNAFGERKPKVGYEVVSSHVVGYAKGLPLALKVIGSNLRTRKSLKAWEDALKDYKRIPRKEIQDVLKVSYDVLEPSTQSVFLDIACFFKGESIEYVEEILGELSASSNIEELFNKSLLNVDNGFLNMHDLIQDMGREIVRQEAPNNPGKRSRLWLQQDVMDVLSANGSGSDAIQGIMLNPPNYTTNVYWNVSAFKNMNRLRILIIRNITFSLKPKHLPNHLRLLHWEEFPSDTFPPKFYPKDIIIINLPDSKITMGDFFFKQFSNLTVMNFSNNKSITTMPDVSKVENLRELRLDYCENLTTVHESVGFLKRLVHLSAFGCTKLENFPQRMFLPSLEVLNLDFCYNLEHFPNILDKMNKPLKIQMDRTSIKTLPDSFANLIGLVSLRMYHCENLVSLPAYIKDCNHLRHLDVRYCYKLQTIPECTNLKGLYVDGCTSLTHVSELPCTIQNINAYRCHKFSSETSNMLWDQVKNEMLESIHMCGLEVPKWFDYRCKGGTFWVPSPTGGYDRCNGGSFWVRGKFPDVYFALVFQVAEGQEYCGDLFKAEFRPVINGRVINTNTYKIQIIPNHVLVCDVQYLFNDVNVLNDAASLFKHDEWNQVHISYEVHDRTFEPDLDGTLEVSELGVFVKKQGIVNWEQHIQFTCPTDDDPINPIQEFK